MALVVRGKALYDITRPELFPEVLPEGEKVSVC